MSEENEKLEENNLLNPTITTKYTAAAEIANRVLAHLLSLCKPDARVVDICVAGDQMILDEVAKTMKKVKEKGIAFPTTVSINNQICHFSPLSKDETKLAEGDVVKIELGVHIDKYMAIVGTTTACGQAKATGRAADVIAAAQMGADVVHRMLKPGVTNTQVTDMLVHVGKLFDCAPVNDVASFQIFRGEIMGESEEKSKQIMCTPMEDGELECGEVEFAEGEVYSIDVKFSTGDGKTKESETQPTIYKRDESASTFVLKTKAAREAFHEVRTRFGAFPFSLRAMNVSEAVA